MPQGRLFVGTSGFAYKEWKPEFYPEDLKNTQMLEYYSQRFPSVEINNTFYRMPTEKVLQQWTTQTPEGFLLTLKASQRITHHSRLKDADELVSYFLGVARALEDRLGVVLFQCPPNLKHDQERLESFVASLPGRPYRFAMEFRHDSWATDEVFDLLAGNGIAWCVSDTREKPAPMRQTSKKHVYLRLRGVDYSDAELDTWFSRVQEALDSGADAFVYFKHEDDPSGIRYARRMLEELSGG
ncbi:MAG: DUF72 domain-containing protein [Actinomycetota bacterium]